MARVSRSLRSGLPFGVAAVGGNRHFRCAAATTAAVARRLPKILEDVAAVAAGVDSVSSGTWQRWQ